MLEVPWASNGSCRDCLSGDVVFGGEEPRLAPSRKEQDHLDHRTRTGNPAGSAGSEIITTTGPDAQPALRGADRAAWHQPLRARIDAPADREQKAKLAGLAADQVTASELAGDPSPGGADQRSGQRCGDQWVEGRPRTYGVAARPSGTEDVYKIYAGELGERRAPGSRSSGQRANSSRTPAR